MNIRLHSSTLCQLGKTIPVFPEEKTSMPKAGKREVRRLLKQAIQRTMTASLLCLLTALVGSAQIGGPNSGKADAANKKAGSAGVKAPASVTQRFEKEGIAIDFSLMATPDEQGKSNGLVAGADAVATLRLTDVRTGQPLTGLHPNAWISARKSSHAPNEAECKDKIGSFMGGLLSSRPDIDLNSYLVLTINHDNTISIINPQLAFSITKLESLIVLPGAGADWVLSKSNDFLYLTLPEQSAVAVINTITRKIVSTIALETGTKPRRITLDPEGHRAWVGLDNSPLVAVIDTKTNKLTATVKVGDGLHNIAFVPGSNLAYVTNSKANTVSVINTNKLTKITDLSVSAAPVPIAYSEASRLVYVAAINGNSISVIDPAKQRVVGTIPTEQGVVALRFAPGGRFGFIVNQIKSNVSILDASTNKIINSISVVKEPDQVVFTPRYAYIHAIASEKFSLIELTDFTKTTPAPVDIQGGQTAPSAMPEEIGVADMIAPTPEGNAVMIANNPDKMIYYYVEGMMAPMGTFSNYKRRPKALLLLDRSISEIAPGTYSAQIKLRGSGSFDMPVLIQQPRIINCFQFDVGESPDGDKNRAGSSIAVESMFKDQRFKAGDSVSLKFKITDAITKQPITGINDLRVLVFEPPGVWQQRQIAKELGGGVYEVTQTFPHAGLFNVMAAVASRGVTFADLPFDTVRVHESAPKVEEKKTEQNGATKQ
jgi:YVTN family beta-propeller protein